MEGVVLYLASVKVFIREKKYALGFTAISYGKLGHCLSYCGVKALYCVLRCACLVPGGDCPSGLSPQWDVALWQPASVSILE